MALEAVDNKINLESFIRRGVILMASSRINLKPHSAALIPAFARFEINTPDRVCAALAQFAHETGGFRWLHELGGARYFAKYDGRKDLGNNQPGDGARFRGRGYIQITGRTNYARMEKETGYPLLTRPELAEDPDVAALVSSCWWREHGLNELADQRKFKTMTRVINGGLNGYEDRKLRYDRLLELLALKECLP